MRDRRARVSSRNRFTGLFGNDEESGDIPPSGIICASMYSVYHHLEKMEDLMWDFLGKILKASFASQLLRVGVPRSQARHPSSGICRPIRSSDYRNSTTGIICL